MQRTFNYTNRHRIDQSEAKFKLIEESGRIPSFEVSFSLEDKGYPIDARLYVEAYYKETRQRFDFGTWSMQSQPSSLKLSEIDLSGRPLFRILIVDESNEHSLILASGNNFRGIGDDEEDPESRHGLLPVKALPLDGIVWRIDLEGETPELLVNSNIPFIMDRMRGDVLFQGLILPTAFRQIIDYLFFDSSLDPDSNIMKRWEDSVYEFTDHIPPSEESREEQIKWLDNVVEEFSNKFDFSAKIIESMESE
ncbi:hypothetical protein [Alcanivorax sp.]|uniref:hypothetical protein n=1 Tax=Alcanivorax sp. TaxID=1872427 RepID=UPI003A8EA9B9